MAQNSSIEWTEATWNPVTGCTKISPGCKHCYAERMALRLKAMGQHRYRNAFRVTLQDDVVELPLRWKKPRVIFVNSMSDLFHEALTDEQIAAVFAVIIASPRHTFQILTKRAERMAKWFQWAADHEPACSTTVAHALVDLYGPANLPFGRAVRALPGKRDFPDVFRNWPPKNAHLGMSVEDQKAADKRMVIGDIRLVRKTGGRSGDFSA